MTLNPTYNFVCHMAHAFFAGFVVLAAHETCGHVGTILAVTLGTALVLVKEFYIDLHYETPTVSGGIHGGIIDSLDYIAGIALALLVLAHLL